MPTSASIGTDIGGHRLLAPLSGTVNSDTFAASNPDGTTVRLEVIRPSLASETGFPRALDIVLAEVSSLGNPHLASGFRIEGADGELAVAGPGGGHIDLAELLAGVGGLSMRRVGTILQQAATGLDAAHDAGLAHGTLEPARLLTSPEDGEPVLVTGFGVLPVAPRSGDPAGLGLPLATTAPERLQGGPPSRAADIYSFGCIAYIAFTGVTPFGEGDPGAVAEAHLNEIPRRLSDVAPELPAALDDAIAGALAKDPAQRIESAGALAQAILEATGAAPAQPAESAGAAAGKDRVLSRWEQSIAAGAGGWEPSNPIVASGPIEPVADPPRATTPAAAWPSQQLRPEPPPAAPRDETPRAPGRAVRFTALGVGVVAAAALAVVLLSQDSDEPASDRTPAASADRPAQTEAAAQRPARRPAPRPTTPAGGQIISWPQRSAFTVVIFVSPSDRAEARDRARRAAALGFKAGVLESADHPNLSPGQVVGFAGVYGSEDQADRAAQRLRERGITASPYAQFIEQ